MAEKNIAAIQKIISQRSRRDYEARVKKLTKSQRIRYAEGKFRFSYSFAEDTLEAIQIRDDYLKDKISEEEYKAYCLKQNLLGI